MPDNSAINAAYASGDIAAVNQLIAQQGITQQEAVSRWGFDSSMLNQLQSMGVSFATAPAPAPSPAIAPPPPAPSPITSSPPAPAPAPSASSGGLSAAQVAELGTAWNTAAQTGNYSGVQSLINQYGATAAQIGQSFDANAVARATQAGLVFPTGAPSPAPAPNGSVAPLTAAQVSALGTAWNAAAQSGDYSAVQSLINQYGLTANQLIQAFDSNALARATQAGLTIPQDNRPVTVPTVNIGGQTTASASGGLYNIGAIPSANVASATAAHGPVAVPVAAPVSATPATAGLATASTANATGYTSTGADAALRGPATTYTPTTAGAAGYTANNAQAAGYDAATANAATWTPGADATVEGRIGNIIASDSPLMQQAATRAQQQVNARGLSNSSLAVQAGQAALYDAAMPIAQQDANTFAQAGQFNASNQQQTNLANMSAENTARQFTAGNQQQVNLTNADAANKAAEFNAGNQQQTGLFNATAANQASQANAAAQNEQASQNAQLGTQTNLANAAAADQAAAFSANAANQNSQFNATQAQQASSQNAQAQTQTSLANVAALLQAGIVNQQQANAMSQFAASQANQMTLAELQNDADIAKFNASESNALTKLGMDSATKMALAQVEATYKTLMQTSASGSEVYKQLIDQVGTVLANKDMNDQAKSNAVSNLVGILNASLGVISQISNLELPTLSFGSLTGAAPVAAPAPAAPAPAPAGGSGYVPTYQGAGA